MRQPKPPSKSTQPHPKTAQQGWKEGRNERDARMRRGARGEEQHSNASQQPMEQKSNKNDRRPTSNANTSRKGEGRGERDQTATPASSQWSKRATRMTDEASPALRHALASPRAPLCFFALLLLGFCFLLGFGFFLLALLSAFVAFAWLRSIV